MRYLSVCSGIEAASVAWKPLGWIPIAFSEIEKFPRAVLAHHYPEVKCHGDFRKITAEDCGPVDLLVGGTPCQDFSVAGLRKGLAGDRGNLTLEFLRLAQRKKPRWIVWENVPGVLSIDGGRAFGAVLGGLAELGYGFAYRVLDAQYFGLAQRRARVFVVGYLGDWRPAAAVLFERESLCGHPAPSRQAREGVAPTIASRPTGSGGLGTDFDCDGGLIAKAVSSRPHSLHREDSDTFVVPPGAPEEIVPPLKAQSGKSGSGDSASIVAFQENQRGELRLSDTTDSLKGSGGKPGQGYQAIQQSMSVRRLTPTECERLMGFPDGYTLIPYRGKIAADGPRYEALGNSFAVPVVAWIGRRIQMVEDLINGDKACTANAPTAGKARSSTSRGTKSSASRRPGSRKS